MIRDILLIVGAHVAIFLIAAVVWTVALYWVHYPYGKRRKSKWQK